MSPELRCHFRPAQPQDVDAVLPLLLSSGPQAIAYGFSCGGTDSLDFLRFAFVQGRGLLGYRAHTVAVVDGRVVGVGAFYRLSSYVQLSLEHLWQICRFYRAREAPDALARAMHLQSTMPPPGLGMHYVAHLGVSPAFRCQGLGTRLLDTQLGPALAMGRTHLGLDVSVENPRAQALYERYGFVVRSENTFAGPRGAVPNTRRMTKPLNAVQRTGPM